MQRIKVEDYPRGLIAAAGAAPPGPWLYTGALENRPDVVARIDRPLWGNPPRVLRRVRSPRLVHASLTARGLPCPALADAEPDPRRTWLIKPVRSAGGAGIRPWRPGCVFDSKRCVLQEWIAGDSYAAIFLGQAPGPTLLLGVTRQLVGDSILHAAPFQYCGSIGPVMLPPATVATLTRIAGALVDEFELRGLFGVDFVLNGDEPWPVEVNPRYTASIEVLERATGQAFLNLHAGAFTGSIVNEVVPADDCQGKFILYASASFTFPPSGPWDDEARLALDDPARRLADIPMPGEPITAGHPILTLFCKRAELESTIREVGESAFDSGH